MPINTVCDERAIWAKSRVALLGADKLSQNATYVVAGWGG